MIKDKNGDWHEEPIHRHDSLIPPNSRIMKQEGSDDENI